MFLKYTSGDQLGPVNLVSVKSLSAGEFFDLSVNMISPAKTGMYQGQWRVCTPSGQYFGGKLIYCNSVSCAILVKNSCMTEGKIMFFPVEIIIFPNIIHFLRH